MGVGSFSYFLPATEWRSARRGYEERAVEGMELGARVDLTTTLDLRAAAGRREAGDGSGRWETGARIGLDWRPHPWLTLRGVYGGGARATAGDSAEIMLLYRQPFGGQEEPAPRWRGLGRLAGDAAPDAAALWRPFDNVGRIHVVERAVAVESRLPEALSGARVRFLTDSAPTGGTVGVQVTVPAPVTRATRVRVRLMPGSGASRAVPGVDYTDTPIEITIPSRAATGGARVRVTTGLDDVFVRVTGRRGGRTGSYTVHNEFARNLAPRIVKRFTTVNVKAGGAAASVSLSEFFTDPEGGALTYSARLPAGSFGPVSLGLTVSGSVLSIVSPANLRPGPVSITVTASDPLGLVTVQVLSVTVQPGDTVGGTGVDGCVADARIVEHRDINGWSVFNSGCSTRGHWQYSFHATNSCSYGIDIVWQWNPAYSDSPPGWGSSSSSGVRAMSTYRSLGWCRPSKPKLRICVYSYYSGRREDGHRCSSVTHSEDNIPWREIH